ncbi:PTS-dependent dihydroxyacetone kinase [Actinobacillus pleuropneumoniae]|nr:PTS-dependent dihydroxyacetone kinase [Actinobacillus pleuropneumoniae]
MEGIIARGRAEPGDKTLCDVWLPLLDELAKRITLSLKQFYLIKRSKKPKILQKPPCR